MISGQGRQCAKLSVGICFALVWTLSISAVQAEEITWQTDVKAAAREAQKQQKPILLQITATWCGFCHKMFDQTFTDASVIRQVNGNFIPVRVDADENEELMEIIGIDSLPTTVIISADLDIVGKISGFKNAIELTKHLETVKPKPASTTVAEKTPEEVELAAFDGICLVTLLDKRSVEDGKAEFAENYRGRRVVFASAEARRQFLSNPSRYWPALDGMCPVTYGDKTERQAGSPESAVIYRGRLWFCADAETRKQFAKQPTSYANSEIRFAAEPTGTTTR